MDKSSRNAGRLKSRQSLAHVSSFSRASDDGKQNATIDLSISRRTHDTTIAQSKKRLRGKSIGPGGLEALQIKEDTTIKTVPAYQPRSILKPTVPLTPPKNIPTFDELRQRSTQRKSPAKVSTEALLIDFSTPAPNREVSVSLLAKVPQNGLDPFSPASRVETVESDQSQNVQEVSEEERLRREQKQAILEQRAARRKSMANRRVSFAPEATLHTWSVVEMPEDSTTSSASNSTRRQSSITAQATPQRDMQSPNEKNLASDLASPVSAKIGAPQRQQSPAVEQNSLRKGRRGGESVSPSAEIYEGEAYSSSPSGDVATESSPIRIEDSIDSDSDTDGDTAMSMDDITRNTINSQGSTSSTQSSLEERLRLAANQAGTRGIEYDEYGDEMSMEIANDTVTNAFQSWNREGSHGNPMDDQENMNPFLTKGKAGPAQIEINGEDDTTQGVTMDITKAVGGIMGGGASPNKSRRKSVIARRRSSLGRRTSTAADSTYGDETMDFTTMAGGIVSAGDREDQPEPASDEDMTMEFTTAVGVVQSYSHRRESLQLQVDGENDTMEMTAALGGILAPIEEQTEPHTVIEDGETVAMELTKVGGRILPEDPTGAIHCHQITMEKAAENNSFKAGGNGANESPQQHGGENKNTPKQLASIASETGSPTMTLKPRSSTRLKSARNSQIMSPIKPDRSTPQKPSSKQQQSTPVKQITPLPSRAKSPERTPGSNQVSRRGVAPVKLFQAEIAARTSPASTKKTYGKQQDLLFAQDDLTGHQTPRVVLHAPKPHQHLRRRSSGIGIDKEGIGSPKVTQLLSRRSSIGDVAQRFQMERQPISGIRSGDPMTMGEEIDAQRAEDQRRESGRFVMEQEANEQQDENVTLQLKDMIRSMSPKKNNVGKLKGRKSLAVGSAKGLLGKRPMELDEDDENGEATPKRLKAVSRDGSPVKSIHLPKPPTKEETTGRLSKREQDTLNKHHGVQTPTSHLSPFESISQESPHQSGRYRDAQSSDVMPRTSFENKLDNVVNAVDPFIEHPLEPQTFDDEKISLQQFLNMTNIHFIELNTTKRRHTTALNTKNDSVSGYDQPESIKSNFVAAATTIPLLELYQHATKELKSYISTGRKIIRSIEAETLADQPVLFREYVEAQPEIKVVMDNQFRNGKTHARLQSKEGWYAWRSQLVSGLRSGLEGIQNGMLKDVTVLEAQSEALDQMLPILRASHHTLARNTESLQEQLENMNSVDYDSLKLSRGDLQTIQLELQEKLNTLETLQKQMHAKHDALSQAAELKEEMSQQIAEASRVCEEHRGWAAEDVLVLRKTVDALKREKGWSLITAEEDPEDPSEFGVALTMSYNETLRLFFHPLVYDRAGSEMHDSHRSPQLVSNPTAPISLTYAPICEQDDSIGPLSVEHRFFLQLLQGHLHAVSMLPKGFVTAEMMLNSISSGWRLASEVCEEVRLLRLAGIIKVSIRSDEELQVKLVLILPDKSRIDIDFGMLVTMTSNGNISISRSVDITPVYGIAKNWLGENKIRKVQAAMTKDIETKVVGEATWISAVQNFEEWYRVQQHKQQQKRNTDEVCEGVAKASMHIEAIGTTTPKSPVPVSSRLQPSKRSPLTAKKPSVLQKKIPVFASRQDKFRISQREQVPELENPQAFTSGPIREKENVNPLTYGDGVKAPAITPEMQEAMMQRTPVKRVGALRRSPV